MRSLAADQLSVVPAVLEQLRMRPARDHLAVLEHDHLVRAAEQDRPVTDHDPGRQVLGVGTVELIDSGRLGHRVERSGRVVQEQHGRFREKGPRERHTLALATGEARSPIADQRVVSVRELRDEVMRLGAAGSGFDLLVGGVRSGEADVLLDGAGEQELVRARAGDRCAQRGELDVLDGPVPDLHRALRMRPRAG